MTVPYQASVLYQQLVEYLRDYAANEFALLRGTAVDDEMERLNDVIHDWFFAPREDLHGMSPREIIRREELDEPNPLPPPSPEDDEVLREMREMDEMFGGETGWYLDDGGFTLLDMFDPEGYDENQRKLEEMEDELDEDEEWALDIEIDLDDEDWFEGPNGDDIPFSRN